MPYYTSNTNLNKKLHTKIDNLHHSFLTIQMYENCSIQIHVLKYRTTLIGTYRVALHFCTAYQTVTTSKFFVPPHNNTAHQRERLESQVNSIRLHFLQCVGLNKYMDTCL